ncbi:hypothetical protein CRUP_025066 [Coryphaenoides rupestris]|nr:hypothetical protein CRUP_025066 [Coryphaenoides rupestris]
MNSQKSEELSSGVDATSAPGESAQQRRGAVGASGCRGGSGAFLNMDSRRVKSFSSGVDATSAPGTLAHRAGKEIARLSRSSLQAKEDFRKGQYGFSKKVLVNCCLVRRIITWATPTPKGLLPQTVNMGALMVIFSLQPKQKRKRAGCVRPPLGRKPGVRARLMRLFPVEDELEQSAVRHRPEGLEQLEAQTRFSRKELQILGVVNEETFKDIYSQFFPQGDASTYAHFLFNAFDTDHNGSDFVMGLSILLRGTIQEKLNWAFNLYDINKDGYITKEEMLDIMKAIYDMMGKCTYPDDNIMRSMHLFENVI